MATPSRGTSPSWECWTASLGSFLKKRNKKERMESNFLKLLEGYEYGKCRTRKFGLELHSSLLLTKDNLFWVWGWKFFCGKHYWLQKWGVLLAWEATWPSESQSAMRAEGPIQEWARWAPAPGWCHGTVSASCSHLHTHVFHSRRLEDKLSRPW